jgi:hypothetical protein
VTSQIEDKAPTTENETKAGLIRDMTTIRSMKELQIVTTTIKEAQMTNKTREVSKSIR